MGITYDIKEIRHVWWSTSGVGEGEVNLSSDKDHDFANTFKAFGVNEYQYYVNSGLEYVVTTDRAYGPYIDPEDRKSKKFPSFKEFYTDLFLEGEIVKQFDPKRLGVPGPLVQVYRIL